MTPDRRPRSTASSSGDFAKQTPVGARADESHAFATHPGVAVLFSAASFRDRLICQSHYPLVALDSSRPHSARQRTKGDRLALMFERHSGAIGRTLRRQGLSAEAAEDATQQAFLIASERLAEIRPDRERAFLFGVVLRVTSSKRRRLARYQFEADMDVHAAPGSAQDEANERVLALELFNQVLERLDRDLAQAFVLFELEELSKNEVARELGIPPGTAASRRRRARQTVEATMARLGQMELSGARPQRPPPSTSALRAKSTLTKLPAAAVSRAEGSRAEGSRAEVPIGAAAATRERSSKVPIAKMPGVSARSGPRADDRRRIA